MSREREREPARNPELLRTLGLALPSPTPRPGAERRIARGIQERLRQPARGWPFWAVLGACVLSACVGVLVGPRLFHAPSKPAVSAAGHSWLALRAARAVLVERANLEIERDDERGTELRLVAGTALFHVQKGTGRSFVVTAGAARVQVIGTVFGVTVADGRVSVDVVEGVVRFTNGGVTRNLGAGETSPPGVHLFALSPAELARLRAPVPVVGAAPSAAAAATTAPSSAEPEPSPSTPSGSSHAVARASPANAAQGSTEAARAAAAPSAAETASNAPAAPNAYQRARALERDGSIAEAASAYAAVASAGDADAEDATFALARLPAQHGDPNAALGAIARYRSAFPNGRYARDIDVLELNAHLAAHDETAALRDAETFLAHFPNDARAWRFRLVRGASRARAGDCAGAASDLERVPDGAPKTAALAPCAAP
ncbi:MAG TPA: FecR family protein [Polyangiaceae bacterium]|nr:FecR family protein [Polyangiaceae bacterium]